MAGRKAKSELEPERAADAQQPESGLPGDCETFHAAVLDSLPAHIAVIDRRGTIVSVNSRWRRFASENGAVSDAAVAVGANYLEVCRRAGRRGDAVARVALKGIEGVLSGDRPAFECEYPCHSPDQERWFLLQVTTNPSRTGPVVVSHLDITQLKRAEDALREMTETLERQVAERTAVAERRADDLRRLAAELTAAEQRERKRLAKLLHDGLQQLLIAARLRLPLLAGAEQVERDERIQEMDELLRACVAASRDLTRELSPPVLQMGTLADILEWVASWAEETYGLAVGVEAGAGIPPAPEHLRVFIFQSVREMLLNVVKHSGASEARVRLYFEEGHVVVQVEDDGRGIDPRALEAQLEQPESFGLFQIRERAEALGGRLEFEALPGGGTRFGIALPVSEHDASPPRESRNSRPASPASGAGKTSAEGVVLRLLLVDDHAVVRQGFAGLLDRQADLEVVGEAADGEEAVRQAAILRPDVVLMDVNMPIMDGFEAARRMKAILPDVVIIGLSLHEDQSVASAMVEAGADGYISKQAPAADVIEAIRRAWAAVGHSTRSPN